MITRPAIFKWRQTEPGIILCAVRWYLRYSLSRRDVEELLEERGLNVDHTTVWRWVQSYGPELEQRLRPHLKPTNKSWRVDETYLRVKGRWRYLYRAIDSAGATIDSAHISRETQRYLATRPQRLQFVFIPKHGSWLNLVENLFSKMTRTMLREIRVSTKQELIDRIHLYFREVNATPVIFGWKYKMDEVNVTS
jgi:transposase